MKRIALIVVGLAALGLLVLGVNFVRGWGAAGPLAKDTTILIRPGTSFAGAARALEKAGAIRSADAFLTRARLFADARAIKAGEFFIPAGASNADIVAILTEGKAVQRLVTIPEGMPSILVHERLMAEPLLTGTIPVPPEGSVLPDSYSFERGEPRAAVLARMQAAMTRTLAELWPRRSARTVVKTPQEALTLAAIVEKETALARERRTVAAVYSNRLRIGMMLQADPTIIYPIKQGKPLGRRILRSEIMAVNDYNTYAMTGLPKGPIANPGRGAIAAVLDPVESSALFFVADGRGGHVFADTLAEHNRNVERWYALRRAKGEM